MRVRMALLALTVAASACAGAPKLSDDGRLIRAIDAFITDLGRAYERRDAAALMAGIGPGFPDREALNQAVADTFARFDRIDLTLSVERIHLDGRTATVYLHWDGQWRSPTAERLTREGGARFVVEADDQTRLTAVFGDNPFAAPSPSRP